MTLGLSVSAETTVIARVGTVKKIRFDPSATYDKYANRGEVQIESIVVSQLADESSCDTSSCGHFEYDD